MVQVYFLLVATNVLSGVLLARSGLKHPLSSDLEAFFLVLEKKWFLGGLGLLTFVTGFLCLLFVLPGDQIFLGDLIPSLTALLAGTSLILEFYQKETPDKAGTTKRLDDILLSNRWIVGLLSIGFGILHFLAPQVIFL